MLQTSRANSSLLAFEELEGPFYFNKTPMALIGTKGLAYISPDDRASWAPYAVDVFYTGRVPLHYCLLEFFNPDTRMFLITGTYKLHPLH